MVVLWGPDLVQIYNDGYAVVTGARHPRALGQSTRECWPEVWHFNAPVYAAVMAGEARSFPGQMLVVERNGVPEDAWFDLTYSPLRDETGEVAGVLVTVIETTDRTLADRRMAAQVERQRHLFDQAPGFICRVRSPASSPKGTTSPRRIWPARSNAPTPSSSAACCGHRTTASRCSTSTPTSSS